jgi:hypothetical protein
VMIALMEKCLAHDTRNRGGVTNLRIWSMSPIPGFLLTLFFFYITFRA